MSIALFLHPNRIREIDGTISTDPRIEARCYEAMLPSGSIVLAYLGASHPWGAREDGQWSYASIEVWEYLFADPRAACALVRSRAENWRGASMHPFAVPMRAGWDR